MVGQVRRQMTLGLAVGLVITLPWGRLPVSSAMPQCRKPV